MWMVVGFNIMMEVVSVDRGSHCGLGCSSKYMILAIGITKCGCPG